jgi:2-polyprenyl-6-methoxyphenol hydroxylase-like FAD-dependent oxidoreductase
VIIGAGVMGLTTALQLSERGYKVTILEKANSVASVGTSKPIHTFGVNPIKEIEFQKFLDCALLHFI